MKARLGILNVFRDICDKPKNFFLCIRNPSIVYGTPVSQFFNNTLCQFSGYFRRGYPDYGKACHIWHKDIRINRNVHIFRDARYRCGPCRRSLVCCRRTWRCVDDRLQGIIALVCHDFIFGGRLASNGNAPQQHCSNTGAYVGQTSLFHLNLLQHFHIGAVQNGSPNTCICRFYQVAVNHIPVFPSSAYHVPEDARSRR